MLVPTVVPQQHALQPCTYAVGLITEGASSITRMTSMMSKMKYYYYCTVFTKNTLLMKTRETCKLETYARCRTSDLFLSILCP